jgi:hypothetical protein
LSVFNDDCRTEAKKQMKNTILGPRLRHALTSFGIQLGCLWLALVAAGFSLRAQAAEPLVSPPGPIHTVYLEYQELPERIIGGRLDIAPQATPFKNEPDLAGRKVCRGTIRSAFSGMPPNVHTNNCFNVPFLWDYLAGRLYLDLDRSGDLAQALQFSTSERAVINLSSGEYYYQPFTNINLTFGTGSDSHPRRVDIHLYGYRGQNQPGGNLVWHSFWQGKVFLEGRDWQIGLVEDANHLTTSTDGHLLLRPWNERNQPFNLEDGSLGGFACPTNLFFQSRAYHLNFNYAGEEVPRYKLELREIPAALGEMALQGQYIDRLILRMHQATLPFTVVLDSPGAAARIPVGIYGQYDVNLKQNQAAAFRSYRARSQAGLSISASNATVLSVGGPLTNLIDIINRGTTLALTYQLRGADGAYEMASNNRTNPPRFTISQAGQAIGSGVFEFG